MAGSMRLGGHGREAGIAVAAALALTALVNVAPVADAEARVRKVVVRQGPFHLGGYQVRYTDRTSRAAPAPRMDGYIVKMYARVVDRHGRRIPVRRIMLHHVLYKNAGRFPGDRRERLCGHGGESFYGTGEENQPLRLPKGYGYRIRRGDHWRIAWMLMNHQRRPGVGYIEYTAWIETSRRLRSVTPYWLRVTGCRGASDPIYTIRGGGAPGSTDRRTRPFRLPRAGMIVGGNGHLHGGATGLLLRQPRCGNRLLLRSRPLYGLPSNPYYNVLPVLHEPGPIATSWPRTAKGIPIGPREPIALVSAYDAEHQHTRVMGIMHLYVWHGRRPRATRCRSLPSDLVDRRPRGRGRIDPPHVVVPLTGLDSRGRARSILRPPGPTRFLDGGASLAMGRRSMGIRNLSIPAGSSLRWTDRDARARWHNATVANGPEGGAFASPMLLKGDTYTHRFTIPGTYRIFCTIHPVTMTQAVDVRPR